MFGASFGAPGDSVAGLRVSFAALGSSFAVTGALFAELSAAFAFPRAAVRVLGSNVAVLGAEFAVFGKWFASPSATIATGGDYVALLHGRFAPARPTFAGYTAAVATHHGLFANAVMRDQISKGEFAALFALFEPFVPMSPCPHPADARPCAPFVNGIADAARVALSFASARATLTRWCATSSMVYATFRGLLTSFRDRWLTISEQLASIPNLPATCQEHDVLGATRRNTSNTASLTGNVAYTTTAR